MKNAKNERERLAGLYARMDEAELRELAQDAGSLTDPAQETLKAELSMRNLDVALQFPAENADKTAHPNLVTLRQFRDIPAALPAKAFSIRKVWNVSWLMKTQFVWIGFCQICWAV